jgi:alpha-D-ribose 1-methylphosphonate 5-phosphate C-P lyase
MIRDDRSMNAEMARGSVDGKVRFLRPDSVNADERHAQERSGALHTQHYGSMGVSEHSSYNIEANRPDSPVVEDRYVFNPAAPVRTDVHATNVPPSYLAGA